MRKGKNGSEIERGSIGKEKKFNYLEATVAVNGGMESGICENA